MCVDIYLYIYLNELYISIQDSVLLPKGDVANQFRPVVPWPNVEGVEVDLNSIRLKNGETPFHFTNSVSFQILMSRSNISSV